MGNEKVLGSDNNDYSNELLLSFTEGTEWDKKLYKQEIKVQKAWLDLLLEAGALQQEEKTPLVQGLTEIEKEMTNGSFAWKIEDEDIHMNIERALTEKLGDLGKKIHLGRSRNDLIATTLKLHVADFVDQANIAVAELSLALQSKAQEYIGLIVPGSTHLQHAQPTTMGHILMGHAWGSLRVKKSLELAKEFALFSMPLGAAAFNGTTLEADYSKLAANLGFSHPCLNSYDSVGERDSLLQAIDAMKLQANHMAKLAQDMIYWASTPMGLLKLPKNWSTGSSIMPNKRNPDVAELIRAKSNKILSKPSYQMTACFGSCYFSDLHELKKVYLETTEEFLMMHKVFVPFIEGVSFNSARAADLLLEGHLLATDYANKLVDQGVSFREAYKLTAEKVAAAENNGMQIHELQDLDLSFEKAVHQRKHPGGSATVKEQITQLKEMWS